MLDVNGELILPVYIYDEPDIELLTKDPDIDPVLYKSGKSGKFGNLYSENSYLSQDGKDDITTPVPIKLLILYKNVLLFI